MTEAEAIYRGFLDNPLDPTPRNIWADWLEENGYPVNAEFFRGRYGPVVAVEWDMWVDVEPHVYWHPKQEIYCPKCNGKGCFNSGHPCLDCGGSIEISDDNTRHLNRGDGHVPRPFSLPKNDVIDIAFRPITKLIIRGAFNLRCYHSIARIAYVWSEDGRRDLDMPAKIPEEDILMLGRRTSDQVVSIPSGLIIDRFAAMHWPGIKIEVDGPNLYPVFVYHRQELQHG